VRRMEGKKAPSATNGGQLSALTISVPHMTADLYLK
jgi:hypothetical protein